MVGALSLIRRSGWIPLAAAIAAWGLIQWSVMARFEQQLADVQQRIAASELHFKDAVVVDIDETSLAKLSPYFGTWPYDRNVYALIIDWLVEQGAKAVVLDILLADSRGGDAALAKSLVRQGNVVLVATTPAVHDRQIKVDLQHMATLAWSHALDLPTRHWPTLLLPNSTLLAHAPDSLVGVVAAEADSDGLLRRLPLAHETEGKVLPALPVAALAVDLAKDKRVVLGNDDGWGIGQWRWPLDQDGFIHLYYPRNADAVLSMRFHDLAEAALGATSLQDAATFFKGKTVFIGSTANFADRVNTPRGTMSGTYALAIAHQTLAEGLAWRPAAGSWGTASAGCR